ncbi:hypothetical protein Glove_332g26 [Diversispora epigaea]|uniref:Calpain catalytic domain-containing protein n=1 Tax=Diversispora epigaea TaxID=1348612 RepID=A0A397HNG1_9GLOM|nr:hypothetical protein Glove_332g26 [Diversispora epigaea]
MISGCLPINLSPFLLALATLCFSDVLMKKESPIGRFFNDARITLSKFNRVFRFRFYRFGEWIEVVIDDYLPTRDGQLIYAHSKDPKEMWCSLLEKAYAKLCGGYKVLETGAASDAIVDLTGTVPETIELNKEGILGQLVKDETQTNLKGHACNLPPDNNNCPQHVKALPNNLFYTTKSNYSYL